MESQQVIDKVRRRAAQLGGYRAAFAHYDSHGDGRLDAHDVTRLLKDCDVGGWLTRGSWAAGIVAALDTNKDGAISLEELERAMETTLKV